MNRSGVVVLAVLFIALFAGLLGIVIGNNQFDKGLHPNQTEAPAEYK